MVDPITASIATSAISQGLGNLFGGGGGARPTNVFTPEMAQQAFNYARNFGRQLEGLYGTPSFAPGVQVSQAQRIPGREIKANAYIDYLTNVKGYTLDNANRKASNKKWKQDKGFKRYIKETRPEGLSVQGGKIKAEAQFTPGGVQVDPMSTAMRQGMYGLGMESLGAAQGLPSMFAGEAARALATRQGLANQALGYLGLPMGQDGLSERGERNLDALKNKYLNDFSGLMEDTSRNIVSQLAETGFSSSNLAKDQLKSYAGSVQSDFLTDALAKLAAQEETMLTGRQARETQALNNMLNAFGQLGATGGIGSVTGGILNPAAAGLFTDPTAAQFAGNIQQQNIANRAAQQASELGILTQPVTAIPGAASTFLQGTAQLLPFAGDLWGGARQAGGAIKNVFGRLF